MNAINRSLRHAVFGIFVLLSGAHAFASLELTLNNDFIQEYQNRAMISVEYHIDKAHPKPNPPAKDGDMHIAGRADAVGLPIVAEIMNANFENQATTFVHQNEGSGNTVHVEGVWRIWCEHGGDSVQVQGDPLQPFTTTNPDHVFEVHPVTVMGTISVLDSLQPIESVQSLAAFKPKAADTAFQRYESTRCRIVPGPATTTIETSMVGFNYVEFWLKIGKKFHPTADHTFVEGDVYDAKDGDLVVRNRRFVFIPKSAPEVALQSAKEGDTMHLLGIPRIDLALVWARVKRATTRPEMLTWSLPYEIIVVGVYPDGAASTSSEGDD